MGFLQTTPSFKYKCPQLKFWIENRCSCIHLYGFKPKIPGRREETLHFWTQSEVVFVALQLQSQPNQADQRGQSLRYGFRFTLLEFTAAWRALGREGCVLPAQAIQGKSEECFNLGIWINSHHPELQGQVGQAQGAYRVLGLAQTHLCYRILQAKGYQLPSFGGWNNISGWKRVHSKEFLYHSPSLCQQCSF